MNLSETYRKAAHLIDVMVVWSETPQGSAYWSGVSGRLLSMSRLAALGEGGRDIEMPEFLSSFTLLTWFFNSSFHWQRTPEGVDFWRDVANNIESLDEDCINPLSIEDAVDSLGYIPRRAAPVFGGLPGGFGKLTPFEGEV